MVVWKEFAVVYGNVRSQYPLGGTEENQDEKI
jgi:hypothetical protein